MQALDDIFSIWTSISSLATALNEKEDTVYRWKKRRRIPEDAWQPVIDAAALRGKTLTIADMHAANRPPKRRGKPAHKPKPVRRRRAEARAVS